VIAALDVTVFIDNNLEGVLDEETEMNMRTGVSTGASLTRALLQIDAALIVESDGSILIISIDDETEADYLRTITYDVTGIAGSVSQAEKLQNTLFNTIVYYSWEWHGGGNATISIYQQNGRVLMSVKQTYRNHLAIRDHFQTVARLTGGAASTSIRRIQNHRTPSLSAPSSVVALPGKQDKAPPRSRRRFKSGGVF